MAIWLDQDTNALRHRACVDAERECREYVDNVIAFRRADQARIGRKLREIYDDITKEALPPAILTRLAAFQASVEKRGDG